MKIYLIHVIKDKVCDLRKEEEMVDTGKALCATARGAWQAGVRRPLPGRSPLPSQGEVARLVQSLHLSTQMKVLSQWAGLTVLGFHEKKKCQPFVLRLPWQCLCLLLWEDSGRALTSACLPPPSISLEPAGGFSSASRARPPHSPFLVGCLGLPGLTDPLTGQTSHAPVDERSLCEEQEEMP